MLLPRFSAKSNLPRIVVLKPILAILFIHFFFMYIISFYSVCFPSYAAVVARAYGSKHDSRQKSISFLVYTSLEIHATTFVRLCVFSCPRFAIAASMLEHHHHRYMYSMLLLHSKIHRYRRVYVMVSCISYMKTEWEIVYISFLNVRAAWSLLCFDLLNGFFFK